MAHVGDAGLVRTTAVRILPIEREMQYIHQSLRVDALLVKLGGIGATFKPSRRIINLPFPSPLLVIKISIADGAEYTCCLSFWL